VTPQRKTLARGCVTLAVAALLATGCSSSKSSPQATTGTSTSPAAASSGDTGGSSSAPAGSAPTDEAAAKQQVTDLYTKYFDSTVDASTKTDLVQNGAKMNALVAALAQAATTAKSSVKINSVSFTSPTHATVSFDILLNGTPALPNAQGQALLDPASGKWQVADVTLCTLAVLDNVSKDVITAAGCP
jgi:hypothetical protein